MCPDKITMNRLIGKDSICEVYVEAVKAKCLIDTGSSISTIAEDFVRTLDPQPVIHDISELGLQVNVANGDTLDFLGCIEANVCVPFLKDTTVPELFLVVPMTEYNHEVPVIVGTNIIRECKIASQNIEGVPTAWQVAYTAISSNRVGVVKTTRKLTLQPFERKTVSGLVRKNFNAETALTEPVEDEQSPRVIVCPRVV